MVNRQKYMYVLWNQSSFSQASRELRQIIQMFDAMNQMIAVLN